MGCFCHYCGHLGHEQRHCGQLLQDSTNGELKEERWGVWLKADQAESSESNTGLAITDPSLKSQFATNTHNNDNIVVVSNSLKDLTDDTILAITMNDRSMEEKVSDIVEGNQSLFYFGQHSLEEDITKKKTPLKHMAMRKKAVSGSGLVRSELYQELKESRIQRKST
ncbi:hypothetical protein PIB30_053762 [Stylosanthes scabra]|uniref:CCHC-type domain-containing protein n=1 Tax=Stylosanthes scabra TaxID=79078 RepID=A0ABU6TIC1_9FABA|nr:hypothetical protein [Stylosanthes scabra]